MLRFIIRTQKIVDGVELESFSTVDAEVPALLAALRPYKHMPGPVEHVTVAGVQVLKEPVPEWMREARQGTEET